MLKTLFDERLHWEELEDMQLSKRMYLEGAFVNIDPKNFVFSDAVNHNSQAGSGTLLSILEVYKWFRVFSPNFVKVQTI